MSSRTKRRRGPRPLHKRLEDRFRFTLRPRPEIIEAIWQYAIWRVDRARRKKGLPKIPITRVKIWCQLSQAGVIARYLQRVKYLDKLSTRERPYRLADPHLVPRTLRRHIGAWRRLGLIEAFQPAPRYNRRRGDWIKQPNVYEFTYAGVLWIKKRKGSLNVPLVV